MFDSHVHDWVLTEEARPYLNSLEGAILAGTTPEQYLLAKQQWLTLPAELQGKITLSMGLHPWAIDEASFTAFMQRLADHPPLLIGEIGLDKTRGVDLALQQTYLQQILEQVSCHPSTLLILHCVKAHQELLGLLRQYSVKGVLHGIYGHWQSLRPFADMGLMFGIGHQLLRPNSRLIEVVKQLPLKQIVIETDATVSHRQLGDKNMTQAELLTRVIERIATIKNVDFEYIESLTTENCHQLLNI